MVAADCELMGRQVGIAIATDKVGGTVVEVASMIPEGKRAKKVYVLLWQLHRQAKVLTECRGLQNFILTEDLCWPGASTGNLIQSHFCGFMNLTPPTHYSIVRNLWPAKTILTKNSLPCQILSLCKVRGVIIYTCLCKKKRDKWHNADKAPHYYINQPYICCLQNRFRKLITWPKSDERLFSYPSLKVN